MPLNQKPYEASHLVTDDQLFTFYFYFPFVHRKEWKGGDVERLQRHGGHPRLSGGGSTYS